MAENPIIDANERRYMAKKSRDEEEAIIALVIGLILATVVVIIFGLRV